MALTSSSLRRAEQGRRGLPTRRVDLINASAFLTPAMLAFTVFAIIPALGGLALSFFDWDLFSVPEFVGLDNFARLMSDAAMWQSLGVSALFVVFGVIPTTVIGFVFATIVNVGMRGIEALRLLYFVPLGRLECRLGGDLGKPVSAELGLHQPGPWLVLGLDGPDWLTDLDLALPSLVVVMIWTAVPLVILSTWPHCSASRTTSTPPPRWTAPAAGASSGASPGPTLHRRRLWSSCSSSSSSWVAPSRSP